MDSNPPADIEDLYPIAVLLDELKNDDIQLRLTATKQLSTIATALGPERTRTEFLPFLIDTIDDEDEVLLALAEELGKAGFVECLGGVEHAACLMGPLETLCTVEETVVRDKAVESLKNISETVHAASQAHSAVLHVEYFMPMVLRLSAGDWFTARVSGSALFPPLYHRLPSDRADLRLECLNTFKQLAEDDTPMVRRSVASNLGHFARAVVEIEPENIELEIVPLFRKLVDDEQDSVRLLIVENAATITGLIQLEPEERDALMLPMVRCFANDKSWRVRYMAADQLPALCASLGDDALRDELLPSFLKLLRDGEAEVRTAAAFKVTDVTKKIVQLPPNEDGDNGLDLAVINVIPVVRELVTDPSQHVRAALASNVMGLAFELGVEVTMKEVLELVLTLLKDEFPDVRLNVISKLDKVTFVMGIDKLSNELLPAIVDLAEDRNWRVRLAIIEHIPLLAKQLGKEFFDVEMKLGDLCLNWLGDCVWSIREAAIKNLKSLTEVFGVEWARENIVPQVIQLFNNSPNYLYRMTALYAVGQLSTVLGADSVEECFLALLTERAATDVVPNIRFCAAKMLAIVAGVVKERVRNGPVKRCLTTLADESEKDLDVRFFAQEALGKLNAV